MEPEQAQNSMDLWRKGQRDAMLKVEDRELLPNVRVLRPERSLLEEGVKPPPESEELFARLFAKPAQAGEAPSAAMAAPEEVDACFASIQDSLAKVDLSYLRFDKPVGDSRLERFNLRPTEDVKPLVNAPLVEKVLDYCKRLGSGELYVQPPAPFVPVSAKEALEEYEHTMVAHTCEAAAGRGPAQPPPVASLAYGRSQGTPATPQQQQPDEEDDLIVDLSPQARLQHEENTAKIPKKRKRSEVGGAANGRKSRRKSVPDVIATPIKDVEVTTSSSFIPKTLALFLNLLRVTEELNLDDPSSTAHLAPELTKLHRQAARVVDAGRMEELWRAVEDEETRGVERVLAICESAIRACECMGPGIASAKTTTRARKSIASAAKPEDGRKTEKKKKSGKSGAAAEEEEAREQDERKMELDDEKEDEESVVFERRLVASLEGGALGVSASLLALDIAIGMRKVDGPNRKLVGEDIISAILGFAKNQMDDTMYATLELFELAGDDVSPMGRLSNLASGLAEIYQRLGDLIVTERFGDQIVVMTYTLCLAPFFIDSTTRFNALGMDRIQSRCIKILTSLFAKNPGQRNAIMEEVVGGLIKIASAGGKKGLRQYKTAMDASTKCSYSFLQYLTNRCFAGGNDSAVKAEKGRRKSGIGSNENEYRFVLDNFLKDLMMLLDEVEWPGVEIMAKTFTVMMFKALDEKKQGDTALKGLALDWLGDVTSRLRKPITVIPAHKTPSMPHLSDVSVIRSIQGEIPKGDITADTSISAVDRLWEAQDTVMSYLGLATAQDPECENALLFHLTQWGQTLSATFANRTDLNEKLRGEVRNLILEYVSALAYKSGDGPSFMSTRHLQPRIRCEDGLTLDNRPLAQLCLTILHPRGALYQNAERCLSLILSSLRSDVISIRTKALKALSAVIVVDRDVLKVPSVKKVVGDLLNDKSSNVREAAVQLLGNYLVVEKGPGEGGGLDKSGLVEEYYSILIPRMLDIAMKTIHELWFSAFKHSTPSLYSSASIAPKTPKGHHISGLPVSVAGEDPSEHLLDGLGPRDTAYVSLTVSGKVEIMNRSMIMVEVVKHVPEGQLRMVVSKALEEKNSAGGKLGKKEAAVVIRSVIECLSERIHACEESNDMAGIKMVLSFMYETAIAFPSLVIPHIKMLHIYITSSASVVNGNKTSGGPTPINGTPGRQGAEGADAKALQALQAEEDQITIMVANIIKTVVPFIRAPDMSLLGKIEQDILNNLSTRNLSYKDQLANSSIAVVPSSPKIQTEKLDVAGKLSVGHKRNIAKCLLIVSYLIRNFDFDKRMGEFIDGAAADISKVIGSRSNALTAVYEVVLFFIDSHSLKTYALQALGQLFSKSPRLMLEEDAIKTMRTVFESGTIAHKVELLKVLTGFLHGEQVQMIKEEQEKKAISEQKNTASLDIKVLVGNAEEMGDAGVSTQLMQHFLEPILRCILDTEVNLSTSAFEAVTIILDQGLVHPVLCVPAIVALQTHPAGSVRERACALYDALAAKHESFIHNKDAECIRTTFEYQTRLRAASGDQRGNAWISGYVMEVDGVTGVERPFAVLSRLYSKIPMKGKGRKEFLAVLVKGFEVELKADSKGRVTPAQIERVNIQFFRFIAENLATLDFKFQEEIFHIVYHAYKVLAQTGGEAISMIAGWEEGAERPDDMLKLVARSCTIMGMLVVLKSHLQTLYNVSDSKCRSYSPDAKSSERLKPAIRLLNVPVAVSWERLPFADSRTMETTEDMVEQCCLFRDMMSCDYAIADEEVGEDSLPAVEALTAAEAPDTEANGKLEDGGSPLKPGNRRASGVKHPAKRKSTSRKSIDGAVKPTKPKRRKSAGPLANANGNCADEEEGDIVIYIGDRPKRRKYMVSMAESDDEGGRTKGISSDIEWA
ncbi:Sister chromatid cohesion protein 2 [Irineochytrium annulatum]|nr:Sister chromatid cohesion protein 2 [Irineochytrium annulatum]